VGESGQTRPSSGAAGALFALAYFLLASLLALSYTWPLASDISGAVFGFPGGAGMSGLSGETLPGPSGVLRAALSEALDDAASFNITKLLNFPLLALASFSLLFYLTGDRGTSAVFGLAAAFSPFHTSHITAHSAGIYWLPLSFLFILKTLREGGYANPVLLGLVSGLLAVEAPSFGLFFMLLVPVFVLFHLPNKSGAAYLLKALALSGPVFSAVVVAMAWPLLLGLLLPVSVGEGLEPRRLSDLFISSAKPLDYLLPSVHNPFLGWLAPDLGGSPLKGHRYAEHTLYIGYTVLILSGCALYKPIRDGSREMRRTAFLFLAAALLMVLVSSPPFMPLGALEMNIEEGTASAESKILLPQYLLFKVFPFIRGYAGAGGAAMLSFTVLAAIGFSALFGRSRRKNSALACAALLLAVEFADFPAFRITRPPLEKSERLETRNAAPGTADLQGTGAGLTEDEFSLSFK